MIVQVLAFIFIVAIGFTSSLGRLTEGRKQLNLVLARSSILTLREQVIALVGSHAAWQKTIPHNPGMACLAPGGTCTDGTASLVDLYDSEDQLFVESSNSTAGYGLDGLPCNSFSTSGAGSCVVRIQVEWVASCGGAVGCDVPEEWITVRFAFNSDQINFNPKRFDIGTDPPVNNPYLIRGSLNPDTTVMRCAAKQRVYVGTTTTTYPNYSVDAAGCISIDFFLGDKGPIGYKGADGDLGPQGATGPKGCDWDDPVCPTPFPTPTPRVCVPGQMPPVPVACVPVPNPRNEDGTMVCNDAGTAFDKCVPVGGCTTGYVFDPVAGQCVVVPPASCTPASAPVFPQELCPQLTTYNNFAYERLCDNSCASTGTCVSGYTLIAAPTPHCVFSSCTAGDLKTPVEYCTLPAPNSANVKGRLACNPTGTAFDVCVPSTDCLADHQHDPGSGGACKPDICGGGTGVFGLGAVPPDFDRFVVWSLDGTNQCIFNSWPRRHVGESAGPFLYTGPAIRGTLAGTCKFVGGVATWDWRGTCSGKVAAQCVFGRAIWKSADGTNTCSYPFTTAPAATPPGATSANQQTVSDEYVTDGTGYATGTCNEFAQWDYSGMCYNATAGSSCPFWGQMIGAEDGSGKICAFEQGSVSVGHSVLVTTAGDGGSFAPGSGQLTCASGGVWTIDKCCCNGVSCLGKPCP